MKSYISRFSYMINHIAEILLVSVMGLVVINAILRLIGIPITGTVELVGFFTSIAIGLSLAYCATQGGHIAVSMFMDKMPAKIQRVIDTLVNIVVFVFLCVIAWRIWIYAITLLNKGQVSMTLNIAYYPFVMAIALGFIVYSLVILEELVVSFKGGVKK